MRYELCHAITSTYYIDLIKVAKLVQHRLELDSTLYKPIDLNYYYCVTHDLYKVPINITYIVYP